MRSALFPPNIQGGSCHSREPTRLGLVDRWSVSATRASLRQRHRSGADGQEEKERRAFCVPSRSCKIHTETQSFLWIGEGVEIRNWRASLRASLHLRAPYTGYGLSAALCEYKRPPQPESCRKEHAEPPRAQFTSSKADRPSTCRDRPAPNCAPRRSATCRRSCDKYRSFGW